MLIHFRGASSMSQPSPAWLRFGYAADDTHIRLQVLKCRGRELTRPLITLDRAAVQARLYGHFQAAHALSIAHSGFVTAPTPQFSALYSREVELQWLKQLVTAPTYGARVKSAVPSRLVGTH